MLSDVLSDIFCLCTAINTMAQIFPSNLEVAFFLVLDFEVFLYSNQFSLCLVLLSSEDILSIPLINEITSI